MNAVEPVSAVGVDPLGREQTKLVVVAQHAGRHLTAPSELSDVEYDRPSNTPSHRVKVNGSLTRRPQPRAQNVHGAGVAARGTAPTGSGAAGTPPTQYRAVPKPRPARDGIAFALRHAGEGKRNHHVGERSSVLSAAPTTGVPAIRPAPRVGREEGPRRDLMRLGPEESGTGGLALPARGPEPLHGRPPPADAGRGRPVVIAPARPRLVRIRKRSATARWA